MTMSPAEVREKVKEIIANVANLDPSEIADDAKFIDDLQLDSLSLLEIGVDVAYHYKLAIPEEKLGELRTLPEAVDLVIEYMESQAA